MRSRLTKPFGDVSHLTFYCKEEINQTSVQTHPVHAKIMSDAILPSLATALGLLGVVPEPLVDLLETHAVIITGHEGLVDELGVWRSVSR